MNIKHTLIAFFFASATWVSAQVDLSLRLEPDRAVLHEPVMAIVRVQNHTGRPITFNDDTPGSRLWLQVEHSPGREVRQLNPAVLGGSLTVPPQQSVTRRIHVNRAYDMRGEGPYTIRVRANWNQRTFASSPAFVDVVPGLEIRRLTGVLGDQAQGERVNTLLTLNRDRGEHLFLRVDDVRAGICYAVVHLGRFLRVREPIMRIDGYGNVNVLHLAAPGRFVHHVFDSNGRRVSRRIYTSEDPGVDLLLNEDGRFVVTGAASSLSDGD